MPDSAIPDISGVVVPGQWASTSGYVPRRYIIVQTVTETEPARPAGKTMGLQLAVDGTADIDAIRSLYDDEYEFDMDMLGWQAHAGFAMRTSASVQVPGCSAVMPMSALRSTWVRSL